MTAVTRYRLLRQHPPLPSGPVLELCEDTQAGQPEEVFLYWPVRLEPLPGESGLPLRLSVSGAGASGTLERLPAGVLLSELSLAAEDPAWVQVVAGVVAAVETLHRAGLSHGQLTEERVWIGIDGRVRLVGAGALPGSVEGDDLALEGLWPDRTVSDEHTDRGTLPLGLQEALGRQVQAVLARRSSEPGDEWLVLEELGEPAPSGAGPIDEVGFDLGTDGELGMLDGWTAGGATGEPTGTLHGDPELAHARMAVLARIATLTEAPLEEVRGSPVEAIRERACEEPPIPLPSPLERPVPASPVEKTESPPRSPRPLLVFSLGALLILLTGAGLLLLLASR